MKKYQKYLIEWLDITHDNEWIDEKDVGESLEEAKIPVLTIGFFIREEEDKYVFCSGYLREYKNRPVKYFDLVIIPKGVIKKITKL